MNELLDQIIKAIWLLMPAGFANMSPIVSRKIFPNWKTPVDFGMKYLGKEIFGSHKTYLGLISGSITGAVIFYLQQLCYSHFEWIKNISILNYENLTPLFGFWIGLCALLGDLVKSFFKRRVNIAPGKPWLVFDEIDWIIGSLLGYSLIIKVNIQMFLICIIVGLILHFIIRRISYWLGWVSEPL